MKALSERQAEGLVLRMRPLPDERRTKPRRRRRRVELGAQGAADLDRLKRLLRTGSAAATEQALAYTIHELEHPTLTRQAAASLAYLQRLSDASKRDLIELALRFVAQELKAGRVVSVI